jgi:hypothetical protein
MTRLPSSGEIDRDLRRADATRKAAEILRRRLRRRTKKRDPERQKEIRIMRRALAVEAQGLRSHKKRACYHDRPYTVDHRRKFTRLLRELRMERQKLTKMLPDDELI